MSLAEQVATTTSVATSYQEHSEDTQDSESEGDLKVGTNSNGSLDTSSIDPLIQEDSQLRSLYERKIEIEKRLVELNKDLERITSKLEKHQSSSNTGSSNGGAGKAGRKRKLPPIQTEPAAKKTKSPSQGSTRKPTKKSAKPAVVTPRPQRTRRKSCILREAEGGAEVQLSPGLAACLPVMRSIMSHRWAGPFNTPVDYVALGIPDYPEIIKHPMDFGTVKSRLESGQYEDVSDFCADMNLVFSNATTYNRPGSDVHIMAQTIQECFQKKMRPIEHREQLRERKAQMMTEDGTIHELKKSVDSIRQELQILLKTQTQSPPTSTKRGAANGSTVQVPAVKNPEDIPMTKEEMKRLRSAINSLPYVHLSAIVKIIGQKMPHLAKQKECDIDITILDNPTLRKLESYVYSVKRKKSSRAPTPLSPLPVAAPAFVHPVSANGQGGKSLADQSLMNANLNEDSESGSDSESDSGSSSDSGSESSSDGNESGDDSENLSGSESEKGEP